MRLVFLLLLLFALVLPVCAKDVKVVLEITGLSTRYDAEAVQVSLESVRGVKEAKVSVSDEQAAVTYDDAVTKVENLIQAVKNTEPANKFDAKPKQ